MNEYEIWAFFIFICLQISFHFHFFVLYTSFDDKWFSKEVRDKTYMENLNVWQWMCVCVSMRCGTKVIWYLKNYWAGGVSPYPTPYPPYLFLYLVYLCSIMLFYTTYICMFNEHTNIQTKKMMTATNELCSHYPLDFIPTSTLFHFSFSFHFILF